MAYSSILGAESAPAQPSGRSADLLGPSDNSDSGSDAFGTSESHEDSDSSGTGERGAVVGDEAFEGSDIGPDRIVNADEAGLGGGADEAEEALDQGETNPEARVNAEFSTEAEADADATPDLAGDSNNLG